MIQPAADTTLTYESAAYVQAEPDPTGQMIYTFRMTSERIDRQGEVVTLDGWDFSSYMTNPVVLNSHQYGDIEAIVGRCVGITRDDQGWNAAIRFNSTEYGRLACSLVEEGDLRAVSVGFRPVVVQYPDATTMRQSRAMARVARTDTGKALVSLDVPPGKAVRHLTKELLEISVVPIPANADAIRLRAMAGTRMAQSKGRAMYDRDNLEASGTGEDHLWQSVAHAMYVVLTTGGGDEAVRRRRYNALERLYRTLDREPPAYTTADTAAKMQGDAKDLQFWEGEHLLVAAKIGRVVSSANQAKLMNAIAALEQAEEHIDMLLETLATAEEGITAVLGTMGVIVPPDADDMESMPVMPTPEMEAAPMYPTGKAAFDATGLRDWLGANNEH